MSPPRLLVQPIPTARARCPLCFDHLRWTEGERCTECRTNYHAECLQEFGGCALHGCSRQGAAVEREPSPSLLSRVRLPGWIVWAPATWFLVEHLTTANVATATVLTLWSAILTWEWAVERSS